MNNEDDINPTSTDTHDHHHHHHHQAPVDGLKKSSAVAVVAGVDHRVHEEPTSYSQDDEDDKERGGPAEPTRGPSFSTAMDHASETTSIHSIPVVRITESPTPFSNEGHPSPLLSPTPSTLSHRPPPSPARSQTFQEPSASAAQANAQRRNRHRSVMLESRSPNRLSGFFNNLMHRRELHPPPSVPDPASSQPPSRQQSAPPSQPTSRPASPPPPRPATPPPSLPAPTLTELGLSLSTLTSDLSPSHFSSPPTSGAFLAPHYLLLCHAQGLDVLPLVSPPAPQPYTLVRRVSFKSVVVMEQRGVLVAIAGRRDGVRVYALEEVKKAIEWRMDVEVKRERERLRRENLKKSSTVRSLDAVAFGDYQNKDAKGRLSTPPLTEALPRKASLLRKVSTATMPLPASTTPPAPLIPRGPLARVPTMQKPRSNSVQSSPSPSTREQDIRRDRVGAFWDRPPPYVPPEQTPYQPSEATLRAANTRDMMRFVLDNMNNPETSVAEVPEESAEIKTDRIDSSDDEAINIVAAGASGSQALDERTSSTLAASRPSSGLPPVISQPPSPQTRVRSGTLRRNRPSALDLTLTIPTAGGPPPEPSPAPTLLSLRQALTGGPPSGEGSGEETPNPNPPADDDEDDGPDVDGRISLAQALMESRLPSVPPPGSTRPQAPILLTPSRTESPAPRSPQSSRSSQTQVPPPPSASTRRRRRRWSIMISNESDAEDTDAGLLNPPNTAPATERHRFTRSQSFRSNRSGRSQAPPSSFMGTTPGDDATSIPQPPASAGAIYRNALRLSRFGWGSRRSEESTALPTSISETDLVRSSTQSNAQVPPPKLEYVKLPGTKNALLIKAVETAKKSFLAILCGDNGEKVELFAGTYRTVLGLSRTFILPDSPRSLELQLQGDDLVEVFLVFSQNVFGLEPATVRVREVRIGRAERRAARRRARENRAGESQATQEPEAQEEEPTVNVTVGVTVAPCDSAAVRNTVDDSTRPPSPTLVASEHPSAQPERPPTPVEAVPSAPSTHPEDLLSISNASTGPYTTFQQLSFAPKFPLASIADDYIIPPTYPSFVEYRKEHEPEDSISSTIIDSSPADFSPPGLPAPTQTTAPQWYYRDPKGVVHGPWKSSLMQAWYKQGLLPPDLPVRRAEDEEFTLLKEVRLQCVDPAQPFSVPPPPPPPPPPMQAPKPLLSPISLLSQPRHFGPPALFFSSRGGHSTTIVDSRGRSVLKGRFVWTNEDGAEDNLALGDIKRLEAFDVEDRSVLVAMRQGGLEAVDLRDALLRPADESRTILPNYTSPLFSTNRRPPFVWKIGTPIVAPSNPLSALKPKAKSGFSGLATKRTNVVQPRKASGPADSANANDAANSAPVSDEVFFMGRKEDEIYFCERNAGSFRILKLAPQFPQPISPSS